MDTELVQSLIDSLNAFKGICTATIEEMNEAENLLDETINGLEAYKKIEEKLLNGRTD